MAQEQPTWRGKTLFYVVVYAFIMSLTLFFGYKEQSWALRGLLFFYAGFLTSHVQDYIYPPPPKGAAPRE